MIEDQVLWDLTCLDAEEMITRWADSWQENRLTALAEQVREVLDEWAPRNQSEFTVLGPTGLLYVDWEYTYGTLTWRTWVKELASALKGGQGLSTSITGRIALACIGEQIRQLRGFSNMWVDESASEIAPIAGRLRRELGLGPLITAIWECWRRELESHLANHNRETVQLYRLLQFLPGKAPGVLKAIEERYQPGAPLAAVVPQASLSAWSISRGFAEEWMPSSSPRILLEASVPRDAIWLAPGYGEGELIISPIGFADHRRYALSPAEGDLVLTSRTWL